MSAQHTPGPWVLATVPTSVGSCHKIGPFPNGDRVATFACVYADGHRLGIDDTNPAAAELAANARLIASAPELLEALGGMLQVYGGNKCRDGLPKHETELDLIAQARAAIAKATGGAS